MESTIVDVINNNVLVMAETREEIEDLKNRVRGPCWYQPGEQVLSFEKIIPLTDGKSRAELWGSASDALFRSRNPGVAGKAKQFYTINGGKRIHCIEYRFANANTPPIPVFECLHALFPKLQFECLCVGEYIRLEWASWSGVLAYKGERDPSSSSEQISWDHVDFRPDASLSKSLSGAMEKVGLPHESPELPLGIAIDLGTGVPPSVRKAVRDAIVAGPVDPSDFVKPPLRAVAPHVDHGDGDN